jgi:ribonuclease BN (tRNA processing enzyme)
MVLYHHNYRHVKGRGARFVPSGALVIYSPTMSPELVGKPSDPPFAAESKKTVALSNSGALELSFIGAGGAFSKKFYQNNVLVVKGDTRLLVDCGSRATQALSLLGLSIGQIENYLITHSHADHIGGLEEVMLVGRYGLHRRSTMVVTDKLAKILWSMSLRGGAAFNEAPGGKHLEFEDFWDQVRPKPVRGADRELCEARVGDIEVRLFRTKHIPDRAPDWKSSFPSYGVILDRRVLFTSDTRYDPEMVVSLEAEYGFEAIFHDCQLFTGGVHASLDELSGLPPAVKAKTRLMHYGDKIEEAMPRIAELGFAGVAEQWRTYSFPPNRR